MVHAGQEKEDGMGSETIRAFIAVEIPEELKQGLVRLQQAFQSRGDRVTWVRPQGMHITLKFLGEIGEESISEIGEEIKGVCAEVPRFHAGISGTGVFPNEKQPRTLWVGIKDGAEPLKQIARDLEARLARIGFVPERRPFSAHITIGRIKEIRDRRRFAAQIAKHKESEIGSMTAEAVHLFESRLRPDGAVYIERFSAPLGGEKGFET
ncbi:MAG: RNA 2',3'-cyclic phosphodiesterase [Nitrospirae bacterium CG_4_9_14_3_um_filter_53_35]|nr:MAG: 2'-5' RNA ligase [Nitrospirae bacterium CG2_30_53_67]PIS37026.1 MAG: RNA 2',3'-cyclic phosphodiesterase [Nitrospirae bacterium CG08_land_8_20_14_0_20_52_24]PIW84956.1 MAG: RNA 2',3'-cyclic phosphodiesterase [Nitrospirae bacterium CG_4_8_14_3_um_filter_50_41]PJA76882.1 MAG: RNA 2',3'-cyclic phosphodiesterase [Nitrospirae bacterium CG_4_9_14_3_um_filter_53_35]